MSEERQQSELEVEERNGAIILKILDKYAVLTPDQAKDVGTVLQTYSYHAKYGSDPTSKNVLAEQMRAKMQTRIPHVVRSLESKNKTPQFIANQIVDILLSEVM